MGVSNHNLFYCLYPKLGLFFLFLTLSFHVIGSEGELENKSGFNLKLFSLAQKSINTDWIN
ncbi:MAG: hypothetical protein COC06_03695 [Bacteroidales bacterium]|nr:MAG: hypothetical protein COC06_03695 [Bacteroidales bacterium]